MYKYSYLCKWKRIELNFCKGNTRVPMGQKSLQYVCVHYFITVMDVNVKMRKVPKYEDDRAVGVVKLFGQITDADIVERIVARTTITPPDVVAVLNAVQEQLEYCIKNGQMLELDGIGSFGPRAHVKMAKPGEDFNADNVQSVGIMFRPSKSIRKALSVDKIDWKINKIGA